MTSPPTQRAGENHRGRLLVNADDWGRDRLTTDRILACCRRGAVSSVSAMVFTKDAERAAALAARHDVEAGLHLNFTTPFSARGCSARVRELQAAIGRHLLRHRLAQVVFHPGLVSAFHGVVAAQLDEFRRLYGTDPARLDGHHHMHLCANVLWQGLLPAGTIVRRSFSFEKGEKGLANYLYRRLVDRRLARRHHLADFFFSLPPLEPAGRLRRIYGLARQSIVELETHPARPDEYRYLEGGEFFRELGDIRLSPPSAVPRWSRQPESEKAYEGL